MPRRTWTNLSDAVRHVAPRCTSTPDMFPDMGGTTGGERERGSKSQPHRLDYKEDAITSIIHRHPGRWGSFSEAEVFWSFWESDYNVQYAMRRLDSPQVEFPCHA